MRNPFRRNSVNTTPSKKKSVVREWLDAAVFAIVAATLIRTFFVEAYTIPSESMEGTMLVNDYLFVSKLSYGPRLPMTPLAVPLVHNTMPLTGGKSYTDAVQWKYHRLPGFGKVERYDVVVFNFPAGDTVAEEVQANQDYYSLVRENKDNRDYVKANYTILTRPVDKKENFIKRCIGIPGDKIEVRDAVAWVNDQPSPTLPHSKLEYVVQTNGTMLPEDFIDDNNITVAYAQLPTYAVFLENDQVDLIKKLPMVVSVKPSLMPKGQTGEPRDWAYPFDPTHFPYNRDNYGPVIVPKKGATVQISPENIALYRRVIANYEGNKLEENGRQILINGQPATSYTFKMDYYWMMGDNRDNSADSRYWGFVPEDHIVGKAWFVWLSYGKGGLRWSRLFRSIHTLEQ